jgi:lysozyme
MQMSQEGIDALLKKFEGCKLKAYRCPAGICTIGYGHTSAAGAPEVKDGMTITQKDADDILRRDLVKFETAVFGMVHQPLTQHQFDVLVDFAYNAGVGALQKSTLLKKVNAAQFDDVPAELMKWTKGGGKVLPGLVRRRQAESAWWVSGEPHDEQEQRIDPDPVPVRTMVESKQGNAAIITASLGGLGAAKEIAAQAQEASDTADQLMKLFGNTNFLIMATIAGLAAAIWFWRKKNMDRDGV